MSLPPNYFRLDLFSMYVLIRDLFYKNIKGELTFLCLLFFLNLHPKVGKHVFFYDWKTNYGLEFFLSIAPNYEREIDHSYITASKLIKLKKLRKKLIHVW
jgi:hypothetical protein